ncbi:uncharacterized protein LOC119431222 isoform X15 [Dermacentor silvarum]|uniref:uncharacterized protein LOC119431222 isoform X15 n=1 Tax=Dermacentor silvarum TaxID=543639 RepID=UPI001896E4FE|nr:uncharacterized protein LOC119431222 isoform X15 [Dermacentor silvarum]
MPDHETGRVHRFRDHDVAGVNWRPTRFVDKVPNTRACGLCRMIPKRTMLLPCAHALCQSCHAASCEGDVGQCPLDQEPFEVADCFTYEFPTKKLNTLKVHCWNEAHGCECTGTMDRMLEHYDKECAFHIVECLRCGEGVRHSDLPTHYVAGCTAALSSAITEYPCSQHTALTIEDVSAALEDFKAMLGDANHDQLHPVIQSQLNELTEQVRNQEARFAEVTRELGASEQHLKDEMAQIAAVITSTVPHQPNPAAEASTSSSLSLRSEKALILRKLEHFTYLSLSALEHLRQASPHPDSSRVIAYCNPSSGRTQRLISALSTTPARIREIGSVIYFLILENCDEILQWQGDTKQFAEITVLHMRDTYFTLAVWKQNCGSTFDVIVRIKFYGMLEDSRCLPPVWRVKVVNLKLPLFSLLPAFNEPCNCKQDQPGFVHFHLAFRIDSDSLKNKDSFPEGKMIFRIELDDKESAGGVTGAPNARQH